MKDMEKNLCRKFKENKERFLEGWQLCSQLHIRINGTDGNILTEEREVRNGLM